MNECPICRNTESRIEQNRTNHVYYVDCIQCGNFSLSEIAFHSVDSYIDNDEDKRLILSYAIRQMQLDTECPGINEHNIPMLLETKLPSLQEQTQNLLLLIKENVKAPGDLYSIDSNVHAIRIGAMTPSALEQIIKHLSSSGEGFIDGRYSSPPGSRLQGDLALTVRGWTECESIISGESKLMTAFMAMDFNNAIVNQLYEEIYKPLCEEYGFKLSTVNKKTGLIDNTIRKQILSSKFVIADLTDDNYGAYWEAGFAEGNGKPVIYCCEKTKFEEKKTHFDTNHSLTAQWLIEDVDYTREQLEEILVENFTEGND